MACTYCFGQVQENQTLYQIKIMWISSYWNGIIKLHHFWIWHFMEHYKVQTIVDWATSNFVHDVQCFKLYSLTFRNVSLCTIHLTQKDQHLAWGVEV